MDAKTICENTRKRLRRHEGRYAEIARRRQGLSLSWLSKFANGHKKNPTVESLQALIDELDIIEGVKKTQPAAVVAEADPDANRIEPVEGA